MMLQHMLSHGVAFRRHSYFPSGATEFPTLILLTCSHYCDWLARAMIPDGRYYTSHCYRNLCYNWFLPAMPCMVCHLVELVMCGKKLPWTTHSTTGVCAYTASISTHTLVIQMSIILVLILHTYNLLPTHCSSDWAAAPFCVDWPMAMYV